MKYVCPECGGSEVVCVVDCKIDPNTKEFQGYVDGHADGAIANKSFNDSCNDCGWSQGGLDVGVVDKKDFLSEEAQVSLAMIEEIMKDVAHKIVEDSHKQIEECLDNANHK